MAASDDTFILVKSLTKSEKRFFRLFASTTEGTKNYMKVFDLMDKMEEYDAKRLAEKTKAFRMNLSHEKIYLRNQLLRAMRNFHSNSGQAVSLRNRLLEISFLYDKGLDKLCLQLVTKLMKEAEESGQELVLMELINWKRLLADRASDFNAMTEYVEKDHPAELELFESLKSVTEYNALYNRLMLLVKRRGLSPDRDFLEGLEQLRNHPLLLTKEPPKAYSARRYYYSVLAVYYHVKGDLSQALEISALLLNEVESRVRLKQDDSAKSYFGLQNNFLGRCIYSSREELFEKYLVKFRHFPSLLEPMKRRFYEAKVFMNSSQLELEYKLYHGEFEKAAKLLPEIEAGIPKVKNPDPIVLVTLLFTIAHAQFGIGQYEETLRTLNKIIHDRRFDTIREDIRAFTFFLKVLVYYETGDQKGLELALRMFGKFIRKTGKLLQTGDLLYSFFRESEKIHGKTKQLELLKKSQAKLLELQAENNEKLLEIFFDIGGWFESKITGRPFPEIVRSRMLKKTGGEK